MCSCSSIIIDYALNFNMWDVSCIMENKGKWKMFNILCDFPFNLCILRGEKSLFTRIDSHPFSCTTLNPNRGYPPDSSSSAIESSRSLETNTTLVNLVELSLVCMEKWFERNSIKVGPASLNPLITCSSILDIGNWNDS